MRTDGYAEISDYGFLSDCRSAALVALDGSIDWLCWPKFDSPSLFARLLDDEHGGRFQITPTTSFTAERRYVPGTNVLQTVFTTDSGRVRLNDWLHMGSRQALCRLVKCLEGEVELEIVCDPRPNYALGAVEWEQRLSWWVADLLRDGHRLVLEGMETLPREVVTLKEGQRKAVTLGWNRPGPSDVFDSRRRAIGEWQRWSETLLLPTTLGEDVQEHVLRSALVLKGLQYEPSGAFVAAATTSLPEEIGGERNWDYRYSWLRDSTFTLYALRSVGKLEEARSWLDWLSMITLSSGSLDLQIMYGIEGEADLHEYELAHLEGFRGSSPVRIGNGAAKQTQLDVPGELMDAIWLQRTSSMTPLSKGRFELVRALAEKVCETWRQPDNGIWEVRGEPKHFVYSKVMCWVALDRAIRLAQKDGYDAPFERWQAERDEIRSEVLREGYDETLGSFTQSYGSGSLDASNLQLAQVGFIDPHDPRFVGTVRAVQRNLTRGGFVDRYKPQATDDGFDDQEGTFTICTLWLVLALLQTGARDEAEQLFRQVLARSNDLGLLSEEIDPANGQALGNTPQAFSHVAVLVCAAALEQAGLALTAPVEGGLERGAIA